MISDEEMERALDFHRDGCRKLGELTYRAYSAEKILKHVWAAIALHSKGSAAAREIEAYASKMYAEKVDEMAKAAGDLEEHKALMNAAKMKVEAWKSQQIRQSMAPRL